MEHPSFVLIACILAGTLIYVVYRIIVYDRRLGRAVDFVQTAREASPAPAVSRASQNRFLRTAFPLSLDLLGAPGRAPHLNFSSNLLRDLWEIFYALGRNTKVKLQYGVVTSRGREMPILWLEYECEGDSWVIWTDHGELMTISRRRFRRRHISQSYYCLFETARPLLWPHSAP